MKWEKVKLEDVCSSITDGDHQALPLAEEGIPFIVIADINNNNRINLENARYVPEDYYKKLDMKRKPQKGDVLLTVKGSFGIPVYIADDKPFVFQRDIAILKCNEKINSLYLFYYMKNHEFYLYADSIAIGAAQRAITLKALRNTIIKIPDLETQYKITRILSIYDDLIENNQKQIKLLEEAAQRLYKEWFVDLRFPGYENTPVVDGVPQGWDTKLMEDVCESIGGGTPSTKKDEYYRNGRIKWVTPTDITQKNGLILLDTEKKITEEGLCHSSAKMVPPYTILMTSRASVGYFGLCEYEVCTNQGFISCIPYNENVRFFLLYNLLNRVDEIRSKAGGSTFLEISKKSFRGLQVLLPSDNILDAFTKVVHPMIRQMESLTKAISILRETRDRLLPKLMSGELEV